MFETPVHVIDFEGSRQSGILEYGVVTLRRGTLEATHTELFAPTGTIADRDRRQHGLSEDGLAGRPTFDGDALWRFFAGLRETGPLCAHNASVEEGLLRSVWPYPRRSPDFSTDGRMVASWGPWLDTLHLYRRLYPDVGEHRLENLIGRFEQGQALQAYAELYCPEGRRQYHCALYDALASALLLRRLFEEPDLEEAGLPWMLRQSAPSEGGREAMQQQRLF
ncbi:MAG: 3'-5' exonuclease [Opitutales bacterium]